MTTSQFESMLWDGGDKACFIGIELVDWSGIDGVEYDSGDGQFYIVSNGIVSEVSGYGIY